jgi:hypothetical protein
VHVAVDAVCSGWWFATRPARSDGAGGGSFTAIELELPAAYISQNVPLSLSPAKPSMARRSIQRRPCLAFAS